tara:strand:+ start:847 stop:1041 length:195 start_codon:yes stop_codon:yes gene_type:complete
VQVGDLVKVCDDRVARLCGSDPGIGIIESMTANLARVRFLSKSLWQNKTKPLARGWVEVISESR